MSKDVVPFTEKEVKKYLDTCIVFWRQKRDNGEEVRMAENYIDAYQSMRMSLFGETLAVEAAV